MQVPLGSFVTVQVTGQASSLSSPTVAGLQSDLIAFLAANGLPASSVVLNTSILGSLEWHYPVSGVVIVAAIPTQETDDLVNAVSAALFTLTGYQATASFSTAVDPQGRTIGTGAIQQPGIGGSIDHTVATIENLPGNIAAAVENAAAGLKNAAGSTGAGIASLFANLQKDVLILGGLVIVGIVVIAFSPQLSKSIKAAR